MAETRIEFKITGNKVITDWNVQEDVSIDGKTENILSELIDTDGDISIPIDKLGTVSKIIVNGSNCNLKITTSTPETIVIPISGLFYYTVLNTFASIITAIEVSTDSTEAVDVTVVIFSEEQA